MSHGAFEGQGRTGKLERVQNKPTARIIDDGIAIAPGKAAADYNLSDHDAPMLHQ
jgi:hypothetical protein